MTFYITRNATPVDATTFASVDDALAAAAAPGWAGGPANEVTMINATTYKVSGLVYVIEAGENPKAARAAARTAMLAQPKPRNAHRHYQSSPGWLSREMDRADSDY